MAITGEAYGGSMLLPNWTNQSLTSNIEQGVGSTLSPGGPTSSGYLAWSASPDAANATVTLTTTVGYLTKIVPTSGGVATKLDMVVIGGGSASNAVFSIYTGTSFATGAVAWTAESHVAFAAAGLVSLTFGGTSSPSYILLQPNVPVWVYSEVTATAPTMAGVTATSATMLNVNQTASATSANNSMSLTSPPTTVSGTQVLAPQTTWANFTSKIWYGLR